MGDRREAYRILVVKLKERDHLEDIGIGERIILKWTFKMWGWRVWTELVWFRIETGGRLL